VAAHTLPTSEIAAPHTAPKMLLRSLSEPILAAIEGGESTTSGRSRPARRDRVIDTFVVEAPVFGDRRRASDRIAAEAAW